MRDLLERVKAATGADDLHVMPGELCDALGIGRRNRKAWRIAQDTLDGSLDAAMALVERCGWRPYTADASIRGRWSWMIRDATQDDGSPEEPDFAIGTGATPALAICAALLTAKINQTEEGAGE